MKLLGRTKSNTTKNKNAENVPHLEVTEVVLINCNIVNNYYQQNSIVLHTFVPNKSFGQLLDIHPRIYSTQNFHILKHGLLIKILNCYK